VTVLSAGLLLYRRNGSSPLDVWIAHIGGPFWARKDVHAWSIPKGEYTDDEDPLAAAKREFTEEIGTPPPAAEYVGLGMFRQPSGKRLTIYAGESDFELEEISSNTFPLEWPKGSGRIQEFPEIDRAQWFSEPEARTKLVVGQLPILDALIRYLG
jgi:predicted NUDIX family NTP pyrophosphohydrolase